MKRLLCHFFVGSCLTGRLCLALDVETCRQIFNQPDLCEAEEYVGKKVDCLRRVLHSKLRCKKYLQGVRDGLIDEAKGKVDRVFQRENDELLAEELATEAVLDQVIEVNQQFENRFKEIEGEYQDFIEHFSVFQKSFIKIESKTAAIVASATSMRYAELANLRKFVLDVEKIQDAEQKAANHITADLGIIRGKVSRFKDHYLAEIEDAKKNERARELLKNPVTHIVASVDKILSFLTEGELYLASRKEKSQAHLKQLKESLESQIDGLIQHYAASKNKDLLHMAGQIEQEAKFLVKVRDLLATVNVAEEKSEFHSIPFFGSEYKRLKKFVADTEFCLPITGELPAWMVEGCKTLVARRQQAERKMAFDMPGRMLFKVQEIKYRYPQMDGGLLDEAVAEKNKGNIEQAFAKFDHFLRWRVSQ